MLLGGLDAGNNTIILSLEDAYGEDAIVIPTLTTPYKDYSFGNEKEDLIKSLDVDITLNYDRGDEVKQHLGRYIVGQKASIIDPKLDLRNGAQKKLGDKELMICMVTTLAYGAVVKQEKDKGNITADYKIVTGLPYLQYLKDREAFAKQLRGNHLVKFRGEYDITVEVRLNEVLTECEGLRAMQSLLIDEDGMYVYKPEQMVGKYTIGLDIGEFTTEMMVGTFSETDEGIPKFSFVGTLCGGWNSGIEEAKQKLIDKLNKEYQTEINRYLIDTKLQSKLTKGKINLSSGEEYDIRKDYKMFLDELGRSISDKIVNSLKGIKGNILEVGLMGGGPKVLDNYFGSVLKDNLSKDLSVKPERITIPANALTINADNYLKRAIALWEGRK